MGITLKREEFIDDISGPLGVAHVTIATGCGSSAGMIVIERSCLWDQAASPSGFQPGMYGIVQIIGDLV